MLSFFHAFGRVLPFALVLAVVPAAAQDYPSRPVTIVVGYTPGATSDLVARTIGERLNAAWGQSVIVDNRSGVGGNIAAAYVARAQPDGYTLMVGTDAMMTTNVYLYKNAPFDPVKDFAPVIYAGANIICLAVNTELPANSVADVIAYAKANPGKLNYGAGLGTPPHLLSTLLKVKAGIDVAYIPYQGAAASITDLLAGRTHFTIDGLIALLPHVKDGKLKALAIARGERWPALPDVPTLVESGFPDFTHDAWTGMVAPAGTPAPVLETLNRTINAGLQSAEMKAGLDKFSAIAKIGSPSDFAGFMRSEGQKWAGIVKLAGASAD